MISKRSSQEDEKAKGEIIEGDLLEQEEKMKRAAIAIVAIFVAWSIIDFIIHGILLQDAYADTESLWRSMNEMKMGLLYFSTFIVVILFVSIYSLLISNKGLVKVKRQLAKLIDKKEDDVRFYAAPKGLDVRTFGAGRLPKGIYVFGDGAANLAGGVREDCGPAETAATEEAEKTPDT